jgi:hypothetical protein
MPLPGVVNGIDMFLLGDVFLRNFYSVFDFDNQEISLAINKHAKHVVGIRDPSVLGKDYLFYWLVSPTIGCISFLILW